ncbi:uncharacterized protein [Amphiura filiformis]|uniref:uncharacterized protein n=1 Tax=Amphiura filiformis TaxID=82378 RepID=UPI003B212177
MKSVNGKNYKVDISSSSGIVNINISITFRRLLFYVIGFNAIISFSFVAFTYYHDYKVPSYNAVKTKRLAGESKTVYDAEEQEILKSAMAMAHLRGDNDTQNAFVIITNTNEAFIAITDNWLESIHRLDLQYNITLICEDKKSYFHYKRRKRDTFNVINTKDYKMKGMLKKSISTYQQLIRRRTIYVRDVLYSGLDVLLVDVDTVWLKDPIKVIRESYNSYDLWIAQGHDLGVPCPCFMYMKAIPSVMNLIRRWTNRLTYKPKNRPMETDQNALQYILQTAHEPGEMNVKVTKLSKKNFPTGIEFFDWNWNKLHVDEVLVAHANHQGREDAKIKRLKEFGLWFAGNGTERNKRGNDKEAPDKLTFT